MYIYTLDNMSTRVCISIIIVVVVVVVVVDLLLLLFLQVMEVSPAI